MGNALVNGVSDNDFIKNGFGVSLFSQYASQSPDIFPGSGTSAQNHRNFGFGHINALIQNPGGHHGPVNAVPEFVQNGLALGSLSLMGDERDNVVPGNAIRLVFLRELGMSVFGYCPSGLNDDLFLSAEDAKEAQSILKYRPSA